MQDLKFLPPLPDKFLSLELSEEYVARRIGLDSKRQTESVTDEAPDADSQINND